ncbi:MAG: hypothetical protein EOO01_44885, partial [Chitinophagaceae bacterium]
MKIIIYDLYQKFVMTSAGIRWVFFLISAFFVSTCISQDHVNFTGAWKLNESKSEVRHFPLCIFGGDRMRSKTMKIATQSAFLTIDAASSFSDDELVIRQEKLIFDDKLSEATFV